MVDAIVHLEATFNGVKMALAIQVRQKDSIRLILNTLNTLSPLSHLQKSTEHLAGQPNSSFLLFGHQLHSFIHIFHHFVA